MNLKMNKKLLLLFLLPLHSFTMLREEKSLEENCITLSPEILLIIREYCTDKARHQFESTGKYWYRWGEKDRKTNIIQKAKKEALSSIYEESLEKKSGKKQNSLIRLDLLSLYKQSYANFLFYYISWGQIEDYFLRKTKGKPIVLLPKWKIKHKEEIFPECKSHAVTVKQETKKKKNGKKKRKKEETICKQMILCPKQFSFKNFKKLIEISFSIPSIKKIVLQSKEFFSTEKIEETIDCLKKFGFSGIITNPQNVTIIASCCKGGITLSPEQFEYFLKSNNAYATIPDYKKSPLILLCTANMLLPHEYVELLLKYGEDPNTHDGIATPLLYLCRRRKVQEEIETEKKIETVKLKNITKILFQKGANLNVKDENKWTPLHFLCTKLTPPLDLITLLLECGADPNLQDNFLGSPFHCICNTENPQIEIIKNFLQHGANPYLKNKLNIKPFNYIQNEDIKQQVITYYSQIRLD